MPSITSILLRKNQHVFIIEIYMNVWTFLIPLTPPPNLELIELCRNWIPVHRVILLIHKIQSTIQVTYSFRFAILIYMYLQMLFYIRMRINVFRKKENAQFSVKYNVMTFTTHHLPSFDLLR